MHHLSDPVAAAREYVSNIVGKPVDGFKVLEGSKGFSDSHLVQGMKKQQMHLHLVDFRKFHDSESHCEG